MNREMMDDKYSNRDHRHTIWTISFSSGEEACQGKSRSEEKSRIGPLHFDLPLSSKQEKASFRHLFHKGSFDSAILDLVPLW